MMPSVFSKLFNVFRRKPGEPFSGRGRGKAPLHPRLEGRIRGTAHRDAGIRESRFKAQEASMQREAQQARKLEEAQNDPEYRFIIQGEWVDSPESSNVTAYRYELQAQKLFIEFHDGSIYEYSGISVQEATSMFHSVSKGTWVWDNLRIRGTKYGARKQYHIVKQPRYSSSKGRGQRLWAMSMASAAEHFKKVTVQSAGAMKQQQGAFMHTLGKFARKTPLGNKGRRVRVGP